MIVLLYVMSQPLSRAADDQKLQRHEVDADSRGRFHQGSIGRRYRRATVNLGLAPALTTAVKKLAQEEGMLQQLSKQ